MSSAYLLKTVNNMGYSSTYVNPFILKFVEFVKNCPDPSLDIGAAYGIATHAALKANAKMIANDIEPLHLESLYQNTPPKLRSHLKLICGAFPNSVNLPDQSLKAVFASHIFHFLSGIQIEQGLEKIFQWLQPGGQLFILAGTPYMEIMKDFIPYFEARKKESYLWPGEISDLSRWSSHESIQDMPKFINFMDESILTRALLKAGFEIKESYLSDREDFPSSFKLDARQSVSIIALKA